MDERRLGAWALRAEEAAVGTGEGRLGFTVPGCPPVFLAPREACPALGPHSLLQTSRAVSAAAGAAQATVRLVPWEAGFWPRAARGSRARRVQDRGTGSSRLAHHPPPPGSGGGLGRRGP